MRSKQPASWCCAAGCRKITSRKVDPPGAGGFCFDRPFAPGFLMPAIRLATLADLPRLVDIYNQAISSHTPPPIPSFHRGSTSGLVRSLIHLMLIPSTLMRMSMDWWSAIFPSALTGIGRPGPYRRSVLLRGLQPAGPGHRFSIDGIRPPGCRPDRQKDLHRHLAGMEYGQH